MAEQEIVKHTKKIFGIWTTENNFLYKLSEFILEVFIIVFAITLSIYFHDRSELRHQRRDVREFLIGLREDLRTDTLEMLGDKESFRKSGVIFKYIINRKLNENLSVDTVRKYSVWIFNTTGLIANSGRFEGFKSSGKIGNIEDKELQNNIMDLYQEDIPVLISSTNFYTQVKQKLFDYLAVTRKRVNDSTTNLVTVLQTDQAFNICGGLAYINEIESRYDSCVSKVRTIISEIDKLYKE